MFNHTTKQNQIQMSSYFTNLEFIRRKEYIILENPYDNRPAFKCQNCEEPLEDESEELCQKCYETQIPKDYEVEE